jgi:transcription elongation factor Elf1
MSTTYELICPNCSEEITVDFEPGEIEDTGSIACCECEDEFEFVHDAAANTITLGDSIFGDEEDEAEDSDDETDEEEEDDAEGEE